MYWEAGATAMADKRISITEEQNEWLKAKIARGLYQDESELFRN